jgi:hypothetical protein
VPPTNGIPIWQLPGQKVTATAPTSGMSSGTVAAIVVGVLAVVGGGYAYYRHTHPARAR